MSELQKIMNTERKKAKIITQYSINPNNLDKQTWVNSVNSDQTLQNAFAIEQQLESKLTFRRIFLDISGNFGNNN